MQSSVDDTILRHALDAGFAERVARAISDSEYGTDAARQEAVLFLRKVRDTANSDALHEALADTDPAVRWTAAVTLGAIKDTAALPELIEALNRVFLPDSDKSDSTVLAHYIAKYILSHIGPPAMPYLQKALLQGIDTDGCVWIAYLLSTNADSTCVPNLVQALDGIEVLLRRTIARALQESGDVASVSALLQALEDPKVRLDYDFAQTLGTFGDVTPILTLLKELKERVYDMRRKIIIKLGALGDVAAILALFRTDNNGGWARDAIQAIVDIPVFPHRVLAAPIPVVDRIAILEAVGDEKSCINNTWKGKYLPLPRYCKKLMASQDVAAEVKQGAREVIAFLEMLRSSDRSAVADPITLLRAVPVVENSTPPAEMLRATAGPQKPVPKQNSLKDRLRAFWTNLFASR